MKKKNSNIQLCTSEQSRLVKLFDSNNFDTDLRNRAAIDLCALTLQVILFQVDLLNHLMDDGYIGKFYIEDKEGKHIEVAKVYKSR